MTTFINSVDKHTGLDLVSDAAGAANSLLAFGNNLQPLPGKLSALISSYLKCSYLLYFIFLIRNYIC